MDSGEIEGRMKKYPESGSFSSESNGEIMEESKGGLGLDEKMFVAVGKTVKENKPTLLWALQKQKLGGKNMKICVIYVHQPAKLIPMPMGGKFPASQVGGLELRAFREQERQEMLRILDDYLQFCAQFGVTAETLHIEADSIEKGIVELISQHRIKRLVMCAAANSKYSRKMVEPKSKEAKYVYQHAPDFCHIWFVCKSRLINTREAVLIPDTEYRPSNYSENYQSDIGVLSKELNSELRLSDFSAYEGSSYDFDQSSAASFSQSSMVSPEAESIFSFPSSSFASEEARAAGPELVALPQSQNKHHGSLPHSEEGSSIDDVCYQLEQAIIEAENLRREAFEESMRRRKAEKQAMEAIQKAKAAERLYFEEVRQRKEIEEAVDKRKEELQNAKNMRGKISLDLQKAFDQKKTLEGEIEISNVAMKELEEKILSAEELLKKCEEERDALQRGRDYALREASELRKRLGDERPSNSNIHMLFSEFSFSDLEKATNCFDPSLKIGEGGYGSIYKGVLRHTEVAIKTLNPNSDQGPQEFQQEVDVLSKLRHPNLVTLIGACPDSWALVYEHLSGGSLEDRLISKGNYPPLKWRTRIRIATELCSVLIFLHSSRPSSVIHGDLKPGNILLSENLVSKLSDFGISRVIPNGEISLEHPVRFFTTEPKGTFLYMDPEFLTSGELTVESDVYSFGVILLRLLTGRSATGIAKEVQYALEKGNLNSILDTSAGDWPFVQAEQLARMALRCCDMSRRNRPDLATEVWRVIEAAMGSSGSLSTLQLAGQPQVPQHFLCPIFQEIMQDPHIATDGFTYEAEAIRGWFDSGNDTSPMTDEQLANHGIVPNLAVRSAIQEWLQLQHR